MTTDKSPRDFSRLDHVIDHFSWDYDEGDLMTCAREYRDAYLALQSRLEKCEELLKEAMEHWSMGQYTKEKVLKYFAEVKK